METLSQKYHVETDAKDWPTSLPEAEREALTEVVRAILARFGEKGVCLYDIERQATYAAEKMADRLTTFAKAALWDFRYACIERALRAVAAEQRWHGMK